jgi:hypothetical protein
MDFFALAFWTGNLFGSIKDQFFKFVFTLIALKLINRHFENSSKK